MHEDKEMLKSIRSLDKFERFVKRIDADRVADFDISQFDKNDTEAIFSAKKSGPITPSKIGSPKTESDTNLEKLIGKKNLPQIQVISSVDSKPRISQLERSETIPEK